MVAGMTIAGAGNDHTIAVHAAILARRLQSHRHFRPWRKRGGAAKFNAMLGNDNRIGREG